MRVVLLGTAGGPALRAIFITHHHSDHNADLALRYHAYDIGVRIPDEGRVDPHPPVIPAFAFRDDSSLTDDDWIGPVRRHYAGKLTLGRDLLSLDA